MNVNVNNKAINKYKWNRVANKVGRSYGYSYIKKVCNSKGGTTATHKVLDFYYNGFVYRCVQDLSKPMTDEGYFRYYRVDVRLPQ